jgi:opacity protein-like surface antigen
MRAFSSPRSLLGFVSFVLLLAVAVAATAADAPANVAGTWNVAVSGGAGKTTQTIVLKQDGGTISGTFKGPRQSGTIDGTVDGKNIKFHVTARIPLDYTGTVDGDSMNGTMSGRGQQGDWTATRSK